MAGSPAAAASRRRSFRTARKTVCLAAFARTPSARAISSVGNPSKWRRTKAVLSCGDSSASACSSGRPISEEAERRFGRDRPGIGHGNSGSSRSAGRSGWVGGAGAGRSRSWPRFENPGREARPRVESVEGLVGLQKRLLDHVLGVRLVAGDAVRHAKDHPSVPLDQLRKARAALLGRIRGASPHRPDQTRSGRPS
jgi:hypothetical protein